MRVSPAGWILGSIGAALAVVVLWDAFETILVPRRIGRRVRLTRYFYLVSWRVWRGLALLERKPSRRESLLGFYGPLSLLVLLACWALGLIVAFALLQWAVLGAERPSMADLATLIYMSGETFFTLGFGDITPATLSGRMLSVIESGLGFGFLGTVVGYLPTMYSAFSQREIEITLLDARAGSPPTAAEFVTRVFSHGCDEWDEGEMREWERWAAQLLETHISYPQLAYYRSQHGNQSWLGALTAILDSSALVMAATDGPASRQAKLTFAMARHALVDITQIFRRSAPASVADRLPPAALAELRRRLASGPMAHVLDASFEERLSKLRLLYEPYAQALGSFLLFELPPWFHPEPRRDNWRRGPWDRQLASKAEAGRLDEDHF
jgi:hypothetical protein